MGVVWSSNHIGYIHELVVVASSTPEADERSVVLRYVSRFVHFGSIKKFQAEDCLMAFVTICYTCLIVFLNIVYVEPTNLIPPDEVTSLQPSTIPARIHGSKLVIVVEQLWCATVWSCKTCLLLLYSTLTHASRQAVLVKIVGGYVVGTYIIMVVLFFAVWCRPFHNYWSVPAANPQCATYHDHLIVNTVFNISSDLMMLCIPLPVLIRAKLPLRKKLILCVVFSMGIFVIICAVLSKYYSFSLPYGVDWVYWYVREVSTAVIVANMPHLWALARRIFNLKAFLQHGTFLRSRHGTNPTNDSHRQSGAVSTGPREWYNMKPKESNLDSFLSQNESQEHITDMPLEIHKDVEFRVEHERASRDLEEALGRSRPLAARQDGLHTGWQSRSTMVSSTVGLG